MKTRFKNLLTKIYLGTILVALLPTVAFTEEIVTENKSRRFGETLSETGAQSADASKSKLAEMVRAQRAKLDNQETAAIATASGIQNVNACDTELRKCMQGKCGNDFSKCYKDSEAIWGDKMDSCRRNTKCTAHEYALIAPEIKADRDINVQLGEYQKIISCGNEYNACIFENCGTTMDKCLAKSDGDKVISKCKSIADKCKEQDSGMASRAMDVFATLRKIAAAQVKDNEKRLYELRDKMEATCKGLGAMFDTRTLDCVYTVNFFADNAETPTASKKLYGGSVFQCTPEWFGIDVTTFKENAYRLTRSEAGASSAALGAGLGTAAGMLASGQIQNAIETGGALQQTKDKRAEKAAEATTEKDCKRYGGTWADNKCTPKSDEEKQTEKETKKVNKEKCKEIGDWDSKTQECTITAPKDTEKNKNACINSGGEWGKNPGTGNKICKCPKGMLEDLPYRTCKCKNENEIFDKDNKKACVVKTSVNQGS